MPISLYAATVPSMIQILGAAASWIDSARGSTLSEEEVLGARLAPNMFPFSQQVNQIAAHSRGAFEGVKKGVFSPHLGDPPATLDGLGRLLEEARGYLSSLTAQEVEELSGNEMRFEFGERRIPFTVEDFLLSFSQPNFYFHATTAYAILRAKGLEIGKRDFMGDLRIKR